MFDDLTNTSKENEVKKEPLKKSQPGYLSRALFVVLVILIIFVGYLIYLFWFSDKGQPQTLNNNVSKSVENESSKNVEPIKNDSAIGIPSEPATTSEVSAVTSSISASLSISASSAPPLNLEIVATSSPKIIIDSDNDGYSDEEETKNGYDPYGPGEIGYKDVAVIINNNSTSSKEIGEYFVEKRAIPEGNIIRITATTSEEINNDEFVGLRKQIEDYLVKNKLQDRINYLVTTKGVPLKVKIGDDSSRANPSSSVESDLALILGKYKDKIGLAGSISNPYYSHKEKFSRDKYSIYLVTRLDAYTVEQVKEMIDHADGPNKITSNSQFILDNDPGWDNKTGLSSNLFQVSINLNDKKYKVIYDNTSAYLINQTNVLGYASWGSNDAHAKDYTENAKPKNTWLPGAIAETFVSTSARSFNYPPQYGQSLIADLIAEGVTGIKGYVYEPFASAMAHPDILFDRYTNGYNLAESFYTASEKLSWMDVAVGDPKAKLVK